MVRSRWERPRYSLSFPLMIWLVFMPSAAPAPRNPPKAHAPNVDRTFNQLSESELKKLGRDQNEIRDALARILARVTLMLQKKYDARLSVQYQGEIEIPFKLAAINLYIDGLLVYNKKYDTMDPKHTFTLFDSYLAPGIHTIKIGVLAFGPEDPPGSNPGYYAGCGTKVYVHKNATTETRFIGEQKGDSPNRKKGQGVWEVEITSRFTTHMH